MADDQHKCPICKEKVTVGTYNGGSYDLSCVRCGSFSISTLALNFDVFASDKKFNRANVSGWIRENQGFQINQSNLDMLSQLQTPPVGVKSEKLLLQLARSNPKAGAEIGVLQRALAGHAGPRTSELFRELKQTPEFKRELIAFSWAQDNEELFYILSQYLEREMQFVEDIRAGVFRITPKGWAYIESLRQGNPSSKIGFIAMWFDESMNQAHLAIEAGIRNAGYKPFRVDQKEHNNDITDEIIAGIRGSKFLVADLTRHRNGVYYEAGFAKGLGLEVIWLCRESDKEDRHFDIEHLNCIFWEENKLPELSKALENRIAATIGRGPLAEKI